MEKPNDADNKIVKLTARVEKLEAQNKEQVKNYKKHLKYKGE